MYTVYISDFYAVSSPEQNHWLVGQLKEMWLVYCLTSVTFADYPAHITFSIFGVSPFT